MTKFVTVNDIEFELGDLCCALEQMISTHKGDHYGEYSLRDYELHCSCETMDKLVEMGLVKNYIGSRMANLYCVADKKAVTDLLHKLYEIDSKDYAEFENSDKIIFTSSDEFSKYNEKLLNGFVTYLNNKHKKNRGVFSCGATIQIVSEQELIKEFNDFIVNKIIQ